VHVDLVNVDNLKCCYCESDIKVSMYQGEPYCAKHIMQIKRQGYPHRTIYDKNYIYIENEICFMDLYNKNAEIIDKTMIDSDDIDKIKIYKWGLTKDRYVYCVNLKTTLHEFIIGFKSDSKILMVDHINRDRLDNRKANLRIVNPTENSINSSISNRNKTGIIGVSWCRFTNKYRSYIQINKIFIHLGRFNYIENAIIARLIAEKQYFGEFAPQKFLFKEYGV